MRTKSSWPNTKAQANNIISNYYSTPFGDHSKAVQFLTKGLKTRIIIILLKLHAHWRIWNDFLKLQVQATLTVPLKMTFNVLLSYKKYDIAGYRFHFNANFVCVDFLDLSFTTSLLSLIF